MSNDDSFGQQAVDALGLNEGYDDDFDSSWDDTSDVDASRIGSGDVRCDIPGFYHFEIISADIDLSTSDPNDMTRQRSQSIDLAFRVLQQVPGQSPVGSVYRHHCLLSGRGGGAVEDWAKAATLNVLVGLGFMEVRDGKVVDRETGQTRPRFKVYVGKMKGMQCIGELRLNKSQNERYDDRVELVFGRGLHTVDDAKVAFVPKNHQALDAIGMGHVDCGDVETYHATMQRRQEAAGKRAARGKAPAASPAASNSAGSAADVDELL